MYKEILPPVTEWQKILEANERSVYQLLELFCKTSDDKPKLYRCTAKSHATIFLKKIHSALFGRYKISITKCCWRVTKIYSQYTLKQAHFKRDFVLMNQKSRQNVIKCNQKRFL